MARVPNKGAPQFTSRAMRPGGEGSAPPSSSKGQKKFDLGASSAKAPKFGKMPGMAPPFKGGAFKGNSKRGR